MSFSWWLILSFHTTCNVFESSRIGSSYQLIINQIKFLHSVLKSMWTGSCDQLYFSSGHGLFFSHWKWIGSRKVGAPFTSLSGEAIPKGMYIYRFWLKITKTFFFGVCVLTCEDELFTIRLVMCANKVHFMLTLIVFVCDNRPIRCIL